MNQALINRIEHSINEQLNTAIEDIIFSAMSTHLECDEFESQYAAYEDVAENFAADISELAANMTESIRLEMVNRVEELANTLGERWEHDGLGAIQDCFEEDGVVDGPARRESWCNFIDSLNKNGQISDYEAANIDFDVESL